MEEVFLWSDNAVCYSNDVLGSISYLIGAYNGLNVCGYVYRNAQCAKGLVDREFDLMKRWVDIYVKEKRWDVASVTDLITVLKYKDGLPNTSVDLISIN